MGSNILGYLAMEALIFPPLSISSLTSRRMALENFVSASVLNDVKRFCQMDLQLVAGGHLLKKVDLYLKRYFGPANLFFFLLPLPLDFQNSQTPVYCIAFKGLQTRTVRNPFSDFVFARVESRGIGIRAWLFFVDQPARDGRFESLIK